GSDRKETRNELRSYSDKHHNVVENTGWRDRSIFQSAERPSQLPNLFSLQARRGSHRRASRFLSYCLSGVGTRKSLQRGSINWFALVVSCNQTANLYLQARFRWLQSRRSTTLKLKMLERPLPPSAALPVTRGRLA